MKSIYWLASYPKSGNTWLRILLVNYLSDAQEPADINALNDSPIASARQVFDDNVGIESSDLTQDEIERYRPGVYRQMAEQTLAPVFMKVHDAHIFTADGQPLFPPDATGGVIYVLRNPLDVAVSFAHHGGLGMEEVIRRMADPNATLVAGSHRLHRQLRQRLLTWSGHVTSWVDATDMRVHIVRYEDLQRDPVTVFADVVRFAELPCDLARIRKAVTFSSFDSLRQQERKKGFRERPKEATDLFFRKGIAGGWRTELPPALAEQIITDHSAVMARFNYLRPGTQNVSDCEDNDEEHRQ